MKKLKKIVEEMRNVEVNNIFNLLSLEEEVEGLMKKLKKIVEEMRNVEVNNIFNLLSPDKEVEG